MPETSSQDLDTSNASTSGEPPAKKRCPAPAFVEEDEDGDLEEEDEEEGMEALQNSLNSHLSGLFLIYCRRFPAVLPLYPTMTSLMACFGV